MDDWDFSIWIYMLIVFLIIKAVFLVLYLIYKIRRRAVRTPVTISYVQAWPPRSQPPGYPNSRANPYVVADDLPPGYAATIIVSPPPPHYPPFATNSPPTSYPPPPTTISPPAPPSETKSTTNNPYSGKLFD